MRMMILKMHAARLIIPLRTNPDDGWWPTQRVFRCCVWVQNLLERMSLAIGSLRRNP